MSRGYSPSFRRDFELPSVRADDPDVVPTVTELLERTVDCDIPGFAIVDKETTRPLSVEFLHFHHEEIVLSALNKTLPRVPISGSGFNTVATNDFHSGTDLHLDLFGRNLKSLEMILRLHTPSIQGTQATLANGKVTGNLGDAELYGNSGFVYHKASSRDYDMQPRLQMDDVLGQIQSSGVTAPEHCEPTVYHFEQHPGTSILFRSMTGIGPASAHGFRSSNPDQPRPTFMSDLVITTG